MNDSRNDGRLSKPQWLLVGLIVVAVLAGVTISRPGKRHRAIERIQQLGGTLQFDPPTQPSRWRMMLSSPRVVSIKLRDTSVNGDDLRELLVFGPLTELDVSGTRIQQGDLEPLSRVRSVNQLSVANTVIGDADLFQISNLLDLKYLNLRGTPIGDDGLEKLGRLASLERIDVSSTAMTAAGMRYLREFAQLKCIWVDEAIVTAESVQELAQMKNLDSIAVHVSQGTGKASRELLSKLPGISVSGYTNDDGPFLWYSSIAWEECTAGVFEVVTREVPLDAGETQKLRDLLAAAMPNGKWPLPGTTPAEILNSSQAVALPPNTPQIASLAEFLQALRDTKANTWSREWSLEKFWYEKVQASDAPQIIAAAPKTDVFSRTDYRLHEFRARALVRFGFDDEDRIRQLKQMISSEHEWQRGIAIEAFREISGVANPFSKDPVSPNNVEQAVTLLLPLCHDKSPSLRRQTAMVLSNLLMRKPKLPAGAMQSFVSLALNEDPFVLDQAARNHPDEAKAAIPFLDEALASKDPRKRASAIQALGMLACADGPAAEKAIDVCLEELKSAEPTVANAAASALGRIATHDHPAAVKRAILGAMHCADASAPNQRAASERALANIAVAIRDRLSRQAESSP